jgi:GNAT superfamily N-acetyltransferase
MTDTVRQRVVEATYREATAQDVEAIAALHADSWRRHYRGAYSDAFLNNEVFADRLRVWTDRLHQPDRSNESTIIADRDGAVVGFAHTILNEDPEWGALLDNIHVRHDLKGGGIGTRLMAGTARALIERAPSSGLYLWVLEGNKAAQVFYQARGGKRVGSKTSEAPGGGTIVAFRYVWPDPSALLIQDASE